MRPKLKVAYASKLESENMEWRNMVAFLFFLSSPLSDCARIFAQNLVPKTANTLVLIRKIAEIISTISKRQPVTRVAVYQGHPLSSRPTGSHNAP